MIRCKKILLFISLLFAAAASAQNPDIDILKSINPRYPDAEVWRITSGSVDWVSASVPLGMLAYGYISKNKTMRNNGYELIIAMGINAGITQLMKVGFNRTRPAEEYPNDIFVRSPSKDKSFPSGHTSQAFAAATTLTLQYHKWYISVPAYIYAGCVGYSRMYLGKHYPTDVLAGALVGVGSSYLSRLITDKLFQRKKIKLQQ
jgi:membrane-associated phospholipid phosphatase